ncbi:MAG: hypothetical protein WKF94_03005 [Solirubrobacteraceae bacterium]
MSAAGAALGDEAPCVRADIGRLSEVGFAPRVSVDDGPRATLDWWRARRLTPQVARVRRLRSAASAVA